MTKATPTALKKLRGNPGHRPYNKSEPMPAKLDGFPPAPKFIERNKYAVSEWERIGPELMELGLITVADLPAFMGYCLDFARWMEAEDDIEENGIVLDLPFGPKKNPAVIAAQDYQKLCLNFMREFGLTPSSRTKIIAPKTKDEDPMEALLAKRRK